MIVRIICDKGWTNPGRTISKERKL